MTNEEAIKNITNDACRCCKTYFEKCDEKEDCAYYIATEALNKQIPKQHHHTRIDHIVDDVRISVCPSCLGVIPSHRTEYPNYCSNCGQKIDWSEVEK